MRKWDFKDANRLEYDTERISLNLAIDEDYQGDPLASIQRILSSTPLELSYFPIRY